MLKVTLNDGYQLCCRCGEMFVNGDEMLSETVRYSTQYCCLPCFKRNGLPKDWVTLYQMDGHRRERVNGRARFTGYFTVGGIEFPEMSFLSDEDAETEASAMECGQREAQVPVIFDEDGNETTAEPFDTSQRRNGQPIPPQSHGVRFDMPTYIWSAKYRTAVNEQLRVEQEVLFEERRRTYLRGRYLTVSPDIDKPIEDGETLTVPLDLSNFGVESDERTSVGKEVEVVTVDEQMEEIRRETFKEDEPEGEE